MNIALVSPGYPPTLGGVESHVGRLADGLAARGHRVEVFTARRGIRRPSSAPAGGVLVHIYPAWRTTSLSAAPRVVVAAARQRRRFDLIHVHSFHASSGFAAALGGPVPVVFTPHYHGGGHTALARTLHRAYGVLAGRPFRRADAVICVSAAEEAMVLRDHPEVAGKLTVIPNGVDADSLRAAVPYDEPVPTVLGVGRLEPYKRFDLLIRAMAEVPDAQLVVVGAGGQQPDLHRLAADLGMSGRVRILGGLSDAEVRRWFATARVFVSLSEHEAFGIAPLEAAVAGARVVLSDIAAHRELADRFLGPIATFSPTHAAGVAEDIRGALRDRDGIPALVEVPDWSRVVALTEAVYQEVARGRGR